MLDRDLGQRQIALLLLSPIALLATIAGEAPVKILTRWSATPSLLIAIVLMAGFLYLLKRLEPRAARPPRFALAASTASALLISGLLVYLLYNRHVYGMVNVSYQPDAGTHVYFSRQFHETTGEAPPYEGCLAFHAAVWWLGRLLHLTAFSQFRLVFYSIVVSVPLASAALAASIMTSTTRPAVIAVNTTLAVFLAAFSYWLFFPLLHGFQALASYAQMFGLIPLLLGWTAYTVCRTPLARLLTAAFAIGLMRYTYGLNLGDLLTAYTLLALCEAMELHGLVRRLFAVLLAVALAYGAYLVYRKIWPMRELDGPRPLLGLALRPAMMGQLIGALFLAAVPALLRLSPPAARTLRFAAAFSVVTAMIQYLYLGHKQPQQYYVFKYQFYGPFVVGVGLTLTAVIAVDALVARQSERWRSIVALLLTVIISVVAVTKLDVGFAWYRKSAAERIHGTPNYASFDALCDLEASRLVERVLAKQHKKLGGFFSPRWAYTEFMNQQLNGATLHWWPFFNDPEFVPGGATITTPGLCYFWDHPSERFFAAGLPHFQKIRELEKMPQRACYPYSPRSQPPAEGGARICSVCN